MSIPRHKFWFRSVENHAVIMLPMSVRLCEYSTTVPTTVESFLLISQKHGSSLSLSLSQTFRKHWKAPAWVSDVFRRNRKRKLRYFYSIWNIQWNHTLGTHRPNIFPISNKFNGQPMNAFHKDIDVKFCF